MGDAAEVNAPDARQQFRDAVLLLASLLAIGTACFFAAIWAVDWLVTRIPPETEAQVFSSVPPETLIPLKQADPSGHPAWRVWQDTLERLRIHPAVPRLDYRLALVDWDQPNAFAIPGGIIAVTSSLVQAVGEDRMAIAMILGHELGHFAHRDHLRSLGRGVVIGLLISTLLGGSDFGLLGNMAVDLVHLRYSRKQEEQADLFGARVAIDTLGQAEGFDRFLRQLAERDQLPSWAYMFSTHPDPKQRIQALETFIRNYRSE